MMFLATILYNLLMAAIDAGLLYWLWHRRSLRAWLRATLVAGCFALVLAKALETNPFGVMRLAAYGLFLHGVVLLLASSALFRRTYPKTSGVAALLAAVLVAVAVDGFLIEPKSLEVTHLRLSSSKIPHPIRIAVIADLQTDATFGAYEKEVLQRTLDSKPDLILLAGDYVQAEAPLYREVQAGLNECLKEIDFRAPLGVFVVRGNIDGNSWREIFRGLPCQASEFTTAAQVGPVRLTCLSARDSFNPFLKIPNPNPGQFHIVLGHAPEYARGNVDADLLLAGHTHGGQVRLPLFGPVATNSQLPPSWVAGLTELPSGGKLLVSRGVGMERGRAPRIRFLCRPELVILDLTPPERDSDSLAQSESR